MERKRLLYLVSSDLHASPFDINMAYDAGFDAVIPYARVDAAAVAGVVQDIMFSRGAKGARFSSIFFSGSDLRAVESMMTTARKTLFPPFQVGLMIDPRGGYTTAAALMARIEGLCAARLGKRLEGLQVLVVAGTGGVGKAVAAMAARDGARVTVTSRGAAAAIDAARQVSDLFDVKVEHKAAPSETELMPLVRDADVVLTTGAAGVQLLSRHAVETLAGPKIIADTNAVPPHGIEGLKPQDDGREIAQGIFALGALAIGDLKFRVEASLLKDLLVAGSPPVVDSRAARARASELAAAR